MPFSLDELRSLSPSARLQYVKAHEADLAKLKPFELDKISSLLQASASAKLREEYPVDTEPE